MITSIEEFLHVYQADPSARISMDVGGVECFFGNFLGSRDFEMDSGLIRRMHRLGILYLYSGILEINPMAIRVLERMQAERMPLTEREFTREILASKPNLPELHDEEPELERA